MELLRLSRAVHGRSLFRGTPFRLVEASFLERTRKYVAGLRGRLNHFTGWVKTGSVGFGQNVGICRRLILRKMKGHPLSLREHNLLVTTVADCAKLVPFSFFFIVPFAELALPIVLRVFPNLLPSTFSTPNKSQDYLQRKLKAKQELADFFQEVVSERIKELSAKDSVHGIQQMDLDDLQKRLLSSGVRSFPSAKELLPFVKLFKEEFKLQKLTVPQLQAVAKLFGLPAYANKTALIIRIRHYFLKLRREDQRIMWEGVENISESDLREICQRRAIKFHQISLSDMQDQLHHYLILSSKKDIPLSLLFWSRTFFLQDGKPPKEAEDTKVD